MFPPEKKPTAISCDSDQSGNRKLCCFCLLVFFFILLHEIFASQLTEQRISIFPFSPGDNEKEIVFHLSDFRRGIEVNLVASLISRKSSP